MLLRNGAGHRYCSSPKRNCAMVCDTLPKCMTDTSLASCHHFIGRGCAVLESLQGCVSYDRYSRKRETINDCSPEYDTPLMLAMCHGLQFIIRLPSKSGAHRSYDMGTHATKIKYIDPLDAALRGFSLRIVLLYHESALILRYHWKWLQPRSSENRPRKCLIERAIELFPGPNDVYKSRPTSKRTSHALYDGRIPLRRCWNCL